MVIPLDVLRINFFKFFSFLYINDNTLINNMIMIDIENVNTFFSALITATGIISGIIIAYLFAKILSIRNERINRQLEINKISNKITYLRKIAFIILKNLSAWHNYSEIQKFMEKNKKIKTQNIHDITNKRFDKFFSKNEFTAYCIDLFVSFKQIYYHTGINSNNNWGYSENILIDRDYNLDDIKNIKEGALRGDIYISDLSFDDIIDFKKFANCELNKIKILYKNIIPDVQEIQINRKTISNLLSKFHDVYLPKLEYHIKINQKRLPSSIIWLFWTLCALLVFGLILPLINIVFDINNCFQMFFVIVSLVSTSLLIIIILRILYNIIKKETKIN